MWQINAKKTLQLSNSFTVDLIIKEKNYTKKGEI